MATVTLVSRSVCAVLAALGLCLWAAEVAASGAAPLSLRDAVDRALAANPRLAAARLRGAIGRASRDVAAERPNPEFSFELAKETPKEAYTVGLPIELGGKRGRRLAVAEAAIRTSEAELNAEVAAVRADVRRAYYARVVAELRLALADDNAALATRVLDGAQARYDAGGVPRLDVVQAQLVVAEAQNRALAARGAADAARVALNALLALPLDASDPVDPTVNADVPVSAETAVQLARTASAELAVANRRIEEQRARVALAQSMRTPDVTPEATLTRRAEPEFDTGWRAAVGITLPLFTTHKAGVQLEDATLAQLQAERMATEARIGGEVASAAALAESQRAHYLRYRDEIIPRTGEVERMAEDSYKLGQSAIGAYLQALQWSREVRARAMDALADYESALADLDRAVGAPESPWP